MAPTEALVCEARCCYLVVAEDFRITPSRDYRVRLPTGFVALRISGQFGAAVPVPAASIRKLTVSAGRSARSRASRYTNSHGPVPSPRNGYSWQEMSIPNWVEQCPTCLHFSLFDGVCRWRHCPTREPEEHEDHSGRP